jgi:hypothetical protein
MITVQFGVNTLQFDNLVGKTPQDVLNELGDALNIPSSGVQVRIDGRPAEMDVRLMDRNTVEFVKAQGEKG